MALTFLALYQAAVANGVRDTSLLDLVNDPDVVVSKAMTYDEMVQYIAVRNGVSIQKAQIIAGPRPLTMDAEDALVVGSRIVTVSLNVKPAYKPKLELIVRTTEVTSTGATYIESVFDAYIYRTQGNPTYQFAGEIVAQLFDRSTWKIDWRVSGDWCHDGTTTFGSTIPVAGGINCRLLFRMRTTLFSGLC